MLPVRCITCNKVLGRYDAVFDKYKVENNDNLQSFFEDMNITRYCCKKVFMTHIDIFQYNTEVDPSSHIQVSHGCNVTKIIKAD